MPSLSKIGDLSCITSSLVLPGFLMDTLLMMFKSMNGLVQEYLQSLFSQRRSVYNLRDSEGKLTLPKPSTNYLKRNFSYSGAMLWNNMLKSLKTLYLLIILNNLLRR